MFLASLADLCRFRRGPEDMPYSPVLLVALLIGCGVLEVWLNLHNGVGIGAVAVLLLSGLAMLGVVFLLLNARGKRERFVQTATAMAAVYLMFGIVIGVLMLQLPLKALREYLLKHTPQPPTLSGVQVLVSLAIFVLGVWRLCVWISTLRRATDSSLPGAILMFILMLVAGWLVSGIGVAVVGAA